MNIREAAGQLERAVAAYGAKTPEGAYRVPLEAQRPVYLVGPPGAGKTAVVAQVAAKLGIGYAAYTMTHHTRQSALGLPLIERRAIGGVERPVTEYTMSEIVAAVWQRAEAGAERGILFLDEINCVSESLMPAMLQLLQYKTFGVHALPRGWVIVCAGNPPRYNRYAHTFDAVTLDRLRVIEVEPELDAWRRYAVSRGVHPAVRSYLALRSEDFYVSDGDRIVTARSWSDLSGMMLAMEALGDTPDEGLVGQYLQVEAVSERFALYLRMCQRHSAGLDDILAGKGGPDLGEMPFEQALFAAQMLSGRLEAMATEWAGARRRAERLEWFAEGVAGQTGAPVEALCDRQLVRQEAALDARVRSGAIREDEIQAERAWLSELRALCAEVRGLDDPAALDVLRRSADGARNPALEREDRLVRAMEHAFDAIEAPGVDANVRYIFLNDLRMHEAAFRCIKKRLPQRLRELREGGLREQE